MTQHPRKKTLQYNENLRSMKVWSVKIVSPNDMMCPDISGCKVHSRRLSMASTLMRLPWPLQVLLSVNYSQYDVIHEVFLQFGYECN